MVAPRILAALVALSGLLGTALVYRGAREAAIDFERGFETAFVAGFHPRERADGRYFRWTDEAAAIELDHLALGGTLEVELRLKTIRPAGQPLPELAFTANGVTVHRARASPGVASHRFEIPATSSSLLLGVESETFASGGRRLGVQVLGVTVRSSEGRASWLRPAVYLAAASLLWFTAAIVAGLPPLLAAGAALAAGGIFLHLLGRGPVPFSSYPQQIALLALVALGLALALRAGFGWMGWLHPGDRSRVIATLVGLAVLELTVATYPLTLSSDAEFQANRMEQFLSGEWHPTSVTQHDPPFRIPYPVSLYVVASPLVAAGVERVEALEIVTALADVLVSGLLILLAWRFGDDLRAGLLAAVVYQLVPMNGLSFSAGNFTNVFAVSMLALGFTALVVGSQTGDRRIVAAAALAVLLSVTAHFGALLEGLVLWPLCLAGLWLLPRPVRDVRRFSTLALAGSLALAGIYYLGYRELVSSQWDRALGGGGAEAEGLAAKLAGVADLMGDQLGWVFLVTALLGSLVFVGRPFSSPFRACAAAWLIATALFFLLELASPVEVRYWLQALPLLALASGLYLSRAFDRGRAGAAAALAASVYIGAIGLRELYEIVLVRYH